MVDDRISNLDEEGTENVTSMAQLVTEQSGTTAILVANDAGLSKHATGIVMINGAKVVSDEVRLDERGCLPFIVRF